MNQENQAPNPPDSPSPADRYEDERNRYYWRNLISCVLVESLWGFACAMVATTTIMAVFLEKLGATKTIIGGYPGAVLLAFAVLQIPAARWTARMPRRLGLYIALHLLPCFSWLAIAWFAYAWGLSRPQALVWMVIGLNTLYALAVGAVIPMWLELSNRFFPDRRRGQAYGLMTMGIGLCGSLGAWYAQHELDRLPFPVGFARIFLIAGLVMIAGILLYLPCKEAVPPETPLPPERKSYLAWLWTRYGSDRRLMHFIVSRYLFETGASAGVFYAVYAIDRFHMSVGAAGTFTLLTNLARAVFSPTLGHMGDRRGYRRVTAWGMIFASCSTLAAILAGSGEWFYLVFIFQAILFNGDVIGVQNLLIEMCPGEDKTPYSAIFNTVMMPARFAAPVLAGVIADRWSIPLVFWIGLALQTLGWVYMLAFVDDPRRPGRRVLATALARVNDLKPW
jgi:MFS family permease